MLQSVFFPDRIRLSFVGSQGQISGKIGCGQNLGGIWTKASCFGYAEEVSEGDKHKFYTVRETGGVGVGKMSILGNKHEYEESTWMYAENNNPTLRWDCCKSLHYGIILIVICFNYASNIRRFIIITF